MAQPTRSTYGRFLAFSSRTRLIGKDSKLPLPSPLPSMYVRYLREADGWSRR
jgi:hypothetical protein